MIPGGKSRDSKTMLSIRWRSRQGTIRSPCDAERRKRWPVLAPTRIHNYTFQKDFSIGTVPEFCVLLKHCIWLIKQRHQLPHQCGLLKIFRAVMIENGLNLLIVWCVMWVLPICFLVSVCNSMWCVFYCVFTVLFFSCLGLCCIYLRNIDAVLPYPR